MTDDAFERHVRELINQGELEGPARLRVGLDEAGYGADVSGTPEADEEPIAMLERLGKRWGPCPQTSSLGEDNNKHSRGQ